MKFGYSKYLIVPFWYTQVTYQVSLFMYHQNTHARANSPDISPECTKILHFGINSNSSSTTKEVLYFNFLTTVDICIGFLCWFTGSLNIHFNESKHPAQSLRDLARHVSTGVTELEVSSGSVAHAPSRFCHQAFDLQLISSSLISRRNATLSTIFHLSNMCTVFVSLFLVCSSCNCYIFY